MSNLFLQIWKTMTKPDRRWWSAPPMIAKYGAAVGSVTAALMSSQWPQIHLTAAPVSLFLCAVMFSAWFGGFRPGLLATALSVLAFKYYFVTPVDSLAVDITEMPRLLIFALSALFVGALSAAQRRTNEELRTEIKERKHAEEALRESEERLQDIVDNTTAVVFVKDLELRYILINREFERRFQVQRDQIRGKTDFDIHSHDIAQMIRGSDRQVIEAGLPLQFEEVAPSIEGERYYVVVKFLLRDRAGEPYGVCGIATDITSRSARRKCKSLSHGRRRCLRSSA
jgi:PAS domain S-box-containing protein